MLDQSPIGNAMNAAANGGPPQLPVVDPLPEAPSAPAATAGASTPVVPTPAEEGDKDREAVQLANAIRDFIRVELKNQTGEGKKPRPKTGWNTFWSVVLLADFLLVATLLIETALEGANLKLFLDVLPVLSGLLVFLLPQIRERVNTISQQHSFRVVSLALLGPLLLSAFPVLKVPAVVLPPGTPLTINGKPHIYDDGAVMLRLWPFYNVKLVPTDQSSEPRDYNLTLKQALQHWYLGTNAEWELWYEVKMVSVTTDIKVRIQRQGDFPPEFLERAKLNGYERQGQSGSVLNTSFSDKGTTGNFRKVRLLPLGTYRFTASKAGFDPVEIPMMEIAPSSLEISFPELKETGRALH